MITGKNMIEIAKMIGMTPAWLTRSGRCELRPWYTLWPTTRWADWIGIFRCACWTSMMNAVTTIASAANKINGARFDWPPPVSRL